jgi:histone acetyltransferase 1
MMSAALASSGAAALAPATPLSDDPHLSSAALCIKMRFGGSERSKIPSSKSPSSSSSYLTGPEFTHQCFPEEWIPGYQPYHDDPRVVEVERRVAAQLLQLPSSSKKRQRLMALLLPEQQHELLHRSLLLHKSHRNHSCHGGTAVQELSIDIQVAPSCRTCHVQLEIRNEPQRTTTKRLKADNFTTATTITSATPETSSRDPLTLCNGDQGNNSSSSCMPSEEILQCLDHALPRRVPSLKDVQNDYLTEPLGQVVRNYTISLKRHKNRTADNDDNHHHQNGSGLPKGNHDDDATLEFCLCLADGVGDPAVEEYHSQVQKLALFWIETAESVDISNDQSGFWKVLYLFRKHPRPTFSTAAATTTTTTILTESTSPSSPKNYVYSLAGFVTMFHFHAPFHKPKPGVIVRICQALILPPYQRQGHGQQMLQCVYDLAYNNNNNNADTTKDEVGGAAGGPNTIVLVNVEDPAPAFVALRNKVDFLHVQNRMEWLEALTPTDDNLKDPVGVAVSVTDEHFFTALPESQALSISAMAKIIPRQVHLVQEMLKLKALLEYTTTTTTTVPTEGKDDNERNTMRDLLEKRFRLMVKKRLNKECREELSGLATLPEKQAFLAKEYDRQLKQYESIMDSSTVHK